MRLIISKSGNGRTQLWLNDHDTYQWANRPGAKWPCSSIAGKRLYAEFEPNGDLVDMALDGDHSANVNGSELDAITTDHLPENHPARRL
jgi:hypothetical protein